MWHKADYFPVSAWAENKLDYPYVGSSFKLVGQKKTQGGVQRGMGSMDYSNVDQRSSERRDKRRVKVIKERGTGKILETND